MAFQNWGGSGGGGAGGQGGVAGGGSFGIYVYGSDLAVFDSRVTSSDGGNAGNGAGGPGGNGGAGGPRGNRVFPGGTLDNPSIILDPQRLDGVKPADGRRMRGAGRSGV